LTQTSIYHDVLNLVEFEYKITLSNPFLSNEGKCSRKNNGFLWWDSNSSLIDYESYWNHLCVCLFVYLV